MKTWTITLSRIPMSMNERERRHWSTRRQEKVLLEHELWAMTAAARVPKVATPASPYFAPRRTLRPTRRSVAVEIRKAQRNPQTDDPANRDSRAKSILDALVTLGYLVDDSDKWLDWRGVTETRHPDGPQTVVTITEDEPA